MPAEADFQKSRRDYKVLLFLFIPKVEFYLPITCIFTGATPLPMIPSTRAAP
jgi:hypothetical protein